MFFLLDSAGHGPEASDQLNRNDQRHGAFVAPGDGSLRMGAGVVTDPGLTGENEPCKLDELP